MKRVACFCIPAHGHTNPMLAVVRALVARGNRVRFYSFAPFEAAIRDTGAEFVSCDGYLSELTAAEEAGLKRVSVTEMTVQDLRITLTMDGFLDEEYAGFRPDVVFSDSVCFWGKLFAMKHGVPLVVSTSTFAFNQLSSGYMKHSLRETADLVLGLGRVSKATRPLKRKGYPIRSVLALVSSDDATDSVVYTSRAFQPCADSFSGHYLFAGPSVYTDAIPDKQKARPMVYVSLGTVINDRPDFYARCVKAFGGADMDVVIACGDDPERKVPGPLPENIHVHARVDQLEVLARADAFVTHCGMNSVSESLYMATPMALYPQTAEQKAVARRVTETGGGLMLEDDSAEGLRRTVDALLNDPVHAQGARRRSADFRVCPGPDGAAAFIEDAPHDAPENTLIKRLNRAGLCFRGGWFAAMAACVVGGSLAGWGQAWIPAVALGVLSEPAAKAFQGWYYEKMSGNR